MLAVTGTVRVLSITLDADNVMVNSISVEMNNVQLFNSSSEVVCINNGTINF